eukprot:m.114155 g.114155  ORF g.114155 m.114155 type:complete len:71 (-) comp15467_c1_seq4:334-546(-)
MGMTFHGGSHQWYGSILRQCNWHAGETIQATKQFTQPQRVCCSTNAARWSDGVLFNTCLTTSKFPSPQAA